MAPVVRPAEKRKPASSQGALCRFLRAGRGGGRGQPPLWHQARIDPSIAEPDETTVRAKTIIEDRFMTRKLPKRGLPPMHPGELLREDILPALDRPKTEIAKPLGVSRQTLYDVLKEKQPFTPVMALRLGKLCGNGPDLWLNLQKRYDLHRAQQELREKIKKIPTLEVA